MIELARRLIVLVACALIALAMPVPAHADDEETITAEELRGLETPPEREIYRAWFERYETERMELSRGQEAFAAHMFDSFKRGVENHAPRGRRVAPQLENLFRLYVFFLTEYEGIQFPDDAIFPPRDRQPPGFSRYSMLDGLLGCNLLGELTRFAARHEGFMMNIWLSHSIRAWRTTRGIKLSDLLLLYMLMNYRTSFLWDIGVEAGVWRRAPFNPEIARDLFTDKTTPSLEYNNMVAAEISRRLSWEELGMQHYEGGFFYIACIHGPIARFAYDHPIILSLIPVIGQCWAAGNALCTLYEGRHAGGMPANRFGAFVSFAFHFAMAGLDATLVYNVARAGGRVALDRVRALQTSLRNRFRSAPATLEEARAFRGAFEDALEETGRTAPRDFRATPGAAPRGPRPGSVQSPHRISGRAVEAEQGVNGTARYRMNRSSVEGVERIRGQPEAELLEHANREVFAAENIARRASVEEVMLGEEAYRTVHGVAPPAVNKLSCADVVGRTRQGMYVLGEAKGANIEKALDQLGFSMNALGRERVIRLEVYVGDRVTAGLSGYTVERGVLVQAGQVVRLNGKPVNVIFTVQ